MPIAVEPMRSRPGWKWSLAARTLRLMVLLILLACGLLVFTRTLPHDATPAQLVEDLRAGRARHLELEPGEQALRDGGQVRWSTGLLTWYRASVPGPGWPPGGTGAAGAGTPDEVLEQLIAGSPRRVKVTPVADLHGERSWWEDRHPAQLAPAAVVIWLLVLFVMLGDWLDHRYAGRWAWFWLFTIGQTGALVYLLLEPRPLWARDAGGTRDPVRRLGGAAGFLAAVTLGLATVGAALGLRAMFL